MHSKDPRRESKYWICDDCVEIKHPTWAPPEWSIETIKGFCGHCDREDRTVLTPVAEYTKPENKEWD